MPCRAGCCARRILDSSALFRTLLQVVSAGGMGMEGAGAGCLWRLLAAERRVPLRDLLRVGGLPSALAREQPVGGQAAAGRISVALPSGGPGALAALPSAVPAVPDAALPELVNATAILFEWRIAGSLRSAVNMAGT